MINYDVRQPTVAAPARRALWPALRGSMWIEQCERVGMDKHMDQTRRDSDSFYLRGYCRVCNRHYFYRNQLDTEQTQFHQHHVGVCQSCHYTCARIKPKAKDWP